MSDPLLVLRDAILQNPESPLVTFLDGSGEIVGELVDAEFIRLGTSGLTFPRQCPTNFRSKKGVGPFYMLDAVVFVVRHRDDSFSVYLQEARKKGLPVVSLVDKKDLVDYLTTAGADSPYVDHNESLPNPVKGFKKIKRSAAAEQAGVSAESQPVLASAPGRTRLVRGRTYDYVSTTDFSSLHTAIRNALGIQDQTDMKQRSGRSASSKDSTNKTTKEQTKTKKSLIDQISSINAPHSSSANSSPKKQDPVITGNPIIIIPNAPSSLITLFNVKEWLEKAHFVTPTVAKTAAASTTKHPIVTISHHFEGDPQPTNFSITDAPTKLSSSDWSRVVGAIILGNTWQFKGWKWSQPATIFSNIVGFYVQWEDIGTDPTVSQWNVKRISISRSKRHLDSTSSLEFWHHLGQKMKSFSHHNRQQ